MSCFTDLGFLTLVILSVSCNGSGTQGPPGPQGPEGPQGPAGPAGPASSGDTGWFNVRSYGAKGDGLTDDGAAIEAALAAAAKVGGGTVYFPRGIYRGSVIPNPDNAQYKAIGLISGHTRLLGDGVNATIIGYLPNQPDHAHIFLNRHINVGTDEDITVEELTLDGNAEQQGAIQAQTGLGLLRVRGLAARHVRFQNVFGTANGGAGEGFHAEFGLSTDALFEGCEVVATGGNTASGFSADSSSNVTYVGCTARGLKYGNGFTHNNCNHVTYVGCRSYSNGTYGFNSEVSHHVTYTGCTAGGVTTGANTYPYASSTPIGNTVGGFIVNGSSDVLIEACSALNNGVHNLWIANGATAVTNLGNDGF